MRYSKTALLCLTVVLLLSQFPYSVRAQAAIATNWKPGRIIEDSFFTDKSSMSVQDIQNFLNAQVPSCDTNGTQPAAEYGRSDITHAQYAASQGWPAPPYVCLRNYYEVPKTSPTAGMPDNSYNHGGGAFTGGVSAAQLIYNAAQQYQISPKVLLVMIQKESAGPLTTDTWPLQTQYQYALGAHCPDSGPGGSANCDTNYMGFSIQISESAALLRWYLDSMTQPWWSYKKPFQTNYVLWNVQTTNCGGSNVFIDTKATAALYTYTPYQPNTAALANMYGKGDSCSAYGNRNFWRIYSDWFGSPTYSYTRASYDTPYARSACTVPQFASNMVGRLYQPDSRDYLYTTSLVEACSAVKMGYIWDGIVMKTVLSTATSAMPIYRLSSSDRHVFTSSASVRDDYLTNKGYKDEGISFYVYSAAQTDSIPVYGLQKDFTFYFTSAAKEAELAHSTDGYTNFGIIFYTPDMNAGDASHKSVYRVARNSLRLYTIDPSEKMAALQLGYIDEGNVGSVDKYPNASTTPVYRLRGPSGDYFYTTSRYERDAAVVLYNYYSEGIAFYALLYSNKPVYRMYNQSSGKRLYSTSGLETNLAQLKYGYKLESNGWYSY